MIQSCTWDTVISWIFNGCCVVLLLLLCAVPSFALLLLLLRCPMVQQLRARAVWTAVCRMSLCAAAAHAVGIPMACLGLCDAAVGQRDTRHWTVSNIIFQLVYTTALQHTAAAQLHSEQQISSECSEKCRANSSAAQHCPGSIHQDSLSHISVSGIMLARHFSTVTRLSGNHLTSALKPLTSSGWKQVSGREAIQKSFSFSDFNAAWAFMSRTALLAEKVSHSTVTAVLPGSNCMLHVHGTVGV